MRKTIYYAAGTICLVLAAALLVTTRFPVSRLTNFMMQEQASNSYKDHYHIGFPIPKNSLRQGAVYLPVYFAKDEHEAKAIAATFGGNDAIATETAEYFEFHGTNWRLQVHRYIDLIIYENLSPKAFGERLCDDGILAAAQAFLESFLPHRKPQSSEIYRFDDEVVIEFTGLLSGLPNRGFPTTITLNAFGDVITATHYYFDYEILDMADIISARAALTKLPQQNDKIRLTSYYLAYDLVDSVLIPIYFFEGHTPCGTPFAYQVNAICFE